MYLCVNPFYRKALQHLHYTIEQREAQQLSLCSFYPLFPLGKGGLTLSDSLGRRDVGNLLRVSDCPCGIIHQVSVTNTTQKGTLLRCVA